MWFSDLSRMPLLRDCARELAAQTLAWLCGLVGPHPAGPARGDD